MAYLFIDRDGTLLKEPADEQVDSLAKVEFLPGLFTWLGKIVATGDYELVLLSNQDGLGTSSFPMETFWPAQNFMLKTLAGEGISFSTSLVDGTFAEQGSEARKPGLGMLKPWLEGRAKLSDSYVIGDRMSDIALAEKAGMKGILIGNREKDVPADVVRAADWKEIYHLLCLPERKASVHRKTAETDIRLSLNLDGTGKGNIDTGLSFFDHMLDQICRHGSVDMTLKVDGDLHVDEHHTIEDTALALGQAVKEALGNKKGVMRYGFCLPMDESLAQVALDFGGRPWLMWKVGLQREKVGDVPTEMIFHFFKSFADAASANLNIKAEGHNEHHIIESIFKAFAKALRFAVLRDESLLGKLPSTKGML